MRYLDLGDLLVLVALAVVALLPWVSSRRAALPASTDGHGGAGRGGSGRRSDDGRGGAATSDPVDGAVVLDLVRAALSSGIDVVGAIEAVGGALEPQQGAVYLRAARALRLGASWSAAWPVRSEVPDALEPAWVDGVDPEPLLAHAAATIRRTRQATAREAAARLGVRLVLPLGLCLLPAFVLLGLVPVLLAAGLELWGG
ncbi:type II secretion system F family protein [Pseudactinotalea terrae]|uniref:type II secretion system F family protein n=1 Tax=Pseudactinotalea terrae TaxID=1743262 RepID=UPI0012E1F37C|nr:type II secretion system F family protein [Pseudactinotalea terrae]